MIGQMAINNKFISNLLDYKFSNEPGIVSVILIEHSEPIDLSDVVTKYNRKPRRVTQDKFLECHVMSAMIRVAIRLLKRSDTFTLIDQRNDKDIISPLSRLIFWTDEGAFMWTVAYGSQWVVRLACRVKISKVDND